MDAGSCAEEKNNHLVTVHTSGLCVGMKITFMQQGTRALIIEDKVTIKFRQSLYATQKGMYFTM